MAKKKKKKIKFTNLFLLIVLLYILVQVVIWTIGYFTKTMVLEEENIDLQIKKKAIVVMDETIIKANEDGIIKYNVEDGEKIKNDKSLFTISQSGQNEEISQKIDDLKNEFSKKGVYTIGRYGAWIYNSMEDSMVKAKELAEKLR